MHKKSKQGKSEMVPAVPNPLSVPGKMIPTVPVSGSVLGLCDQKKSFGAEAGFRELHH